jgi:hypothetical protein
MYFREFSSLRGGRGRFTGEPCSVGEGPILKLALGFRYTLPSELEGRHVAGESSNAVTYRLEAPCGV